MTLKGHEDEVLDVSFDLFGHQLASASADATAILWNIDEITEIKQLKHLRGHGSEITKASPPTQVLYK